MCLQVETVGHEPAALIRGEIGVEGGCTVYYKLLIGWCLCHVLIACVHVYVYNEYCCEMASK